MKKKSMFPKHIKKTSLPKCLAAKTSSTLRRRAIALFHEKSNNLDTLSPHDPQHLLYELEVNKIVVELQNEELRQTQSELESRLRDINPFDFAPVGYFTLGKDGLIRRVNPEGVNFLGGERVDPQGRQMGLFVANADKPKFIVFLKKVFESRNKETCDLVLYQGDARQPLPLPFTRILFSDDKQRVVRIMALSAEDRQTCSMVLVDITDQKKADEKIKIEAELLRICYLAIHPTSLIHELVVKFKEFTGCEAVGVRLHRDEDFPYYETSGFSDRFVKAENSLCDKDVQGKLLRDFNGNPVLDCMCGNILCGRFDPSKSFFTKHGSFWSSCTTELLATTTDEDRQARTRNRCNGEGYESVALIPLRSQGKTYGLFQFNDHRKGCFNLERIELLEHLVDYVTLALANLESTQALNESESRYHTLFNTNMDAILITQPDGQIQYANPAACQVLGYSEEELVKLASGVIVDVTDPHLLTALEERARTGKFFGEITFIRKDGSSFPVEITSVIYPTGSGEPGSHIVFRDISQRKQAEADLRDSEEKYRAIFNNEMYGISIFDIQTLHFIDVNDTFCRLYGYNRTELLSELTILDLTAERQASEKALSQTFIEGATFVPLRLHRKKDGSTFPVEIVGSPYFWKEKRVMYILVHDITVRRRAEEELQSLNASLEQRVRERTLEVQLANRALTDAQETERRALALEIHDELGQVLNRVKLSLDMVPMLEPEESNKQLTLASELIREMISRVRRITIELRPHMLDDFGLLPTLQWLFKTYLQQTGCQVNFKYANLDQRFSPQVEISAFRVIQESLTNIIRHAVDKNVEVEVNADEQNLHLVIIDQGEGFDLQAVLDKKNSSGLSGMRERARQLGGELTIHSEPRQGTTITAVLPLRSLAEA